MRNTSLSVLRNQNSPVPATATGTGSPSNASSSASVVLTKTVGIALAETARPGTLAFTSLKLSSAGSLLKLCGSFPAGDHGPFRSAAVYQDDSFRRYSALVVTTWNRSQLVL